MQETPTLPCGSQAIQETVTGIPETVTSIPYFFHLALHWCGNPSSTFALGWPSLVVEGPYLGPSDLVWEGVGCEGGCRGSSLD